MGINKSMQKTTQIHQDNTNTLLISIWYSLNIKDKELNHFLKSFLSPINKLLGSCIDSNYIYHDVDKSPHVDYNNPELKNLTCQLGVNIAGELDKWLMNQINQSKIELIFEHFEFIHDELILLFLKTLLESAEKMLIIKVSAGGGMQEFLRDNKIGKEKKLVVHCFGDFKVLTTDQNKELQWRTRKARELFAYLIHLRGIYVDRKTLIEKLWAEKEPDNSVASLHSNIYHIRKELEKAGFFNILECENRKYRVNMDNVLTELNDVQFMSRAVEEKDYGNLLHCQNTLLNYKGRYMENIDANWNIEWTEYYETIFIKAYLMISEKLVESGYYEEAIKYLNIGLGIDHYSEKLSALLIRCYGKLRDFKNMKNSYQKYKKILMDDLGINYSELLESSYLKGLKRCQE